MTFQNCPDQGTTLCLESSSEEEDGELGTEPFANTSWNCSSGKSEGQRWVASRRSLSLEPLFLCRRLSISLCKPLSISWCCSCRKRMFCSSCATLAASDPLVWSGLRAASSGWRFTGTISALTLPDLDLFTWIQKESLLIFVDNCNRNWERS